MADVSQAASVLLVAGGLVYASRQLGALREQVADGARTQKLQATKDFLEIVAVDEVRATRRWLLSTPTAGHSAPDRHEGILRLAVAYDRIGLLIEHGLLDADLVFGWQGPEIVRLWHLVREKVAAERKLEGRHRYCIYFGRMAQDFMAKEGRSEIIEDPAVSAG